uniref:Uncharacterized protein n=1 Tax=Anguilla anguilla TaxID=7936 RepID=A0A0E9QNX4_ANGAN
MQKGFCRCSTSVVLFSQTPIKIYTPLSKNQLKPSYSI